jgi:hypothetical protein
MICSHCDRGQIYCTGGCAWTARRIKQREAGRRYQQSYRGRRRHAERMARYRARRAGRGPALAKKVTHHGPPATASRDVQCGGSGDGPEGAQPRVRRCHWCAGYCPDHLRTDFLRRRGVRWFDKIETAEHHYDDTT